MPGGRRVALRDRGLIAALLTFAGCGAGGGASGGAVSAADRPPPLGCYQIEWNADMARMGLPWGFELWAEPLGEEGDATAYRAVTRVTATRRSDVPFNVWRRIDDERIRVGYAPVGGALSLALHPEGDALVGTVQAVGDALEPGQDPGPRPPEFVRAWRVVCPSPGPGG